MECPVCAPIVSPIATEIVVSEYMRRYKFPQRPQARLLSDISPLSSLLILTYIYKLSSSHEIVRPKPSVHIPVTYFRLCSRIQIPRSSSKDAIGELDANPQLPTIHEIMGRWLSRTGWNETYGNSHIAP